MKERLDVLLVKKGLAASREKAKAIIMSGVVFVDGQREDKAGTMVKEELPIEIKGKTLKYVSRVVLNPWSFSRLVNSSCVSTGCFVISSMIACCLFFFMLFHQLSPEAYDKNYFPEP